MQVKINQNSFFVFDLDDTLFQEIDFLQSAYKHISNLLANKINCDIYEEMLERYRRKENVFQWIISEYGKFMRHIDVNWLLHEYREHYPAIKLNEGAAAFLQSLDVLGTPIGLITDGRSSTQRNKLRALGIENIFADIIISEEFGSTKPDPKNYQYFVTKYPNKEFYYVGDNPAKDFIVPIELGWRTICLKNNGLNIHDQNFSDHLKPHNIIDSFNDLEIIQETIAYA